MQTSQTKTRLRIIVSIASAFTILVGFPTVISVVSYIIDDDSGSTIGHSIELAILSAALGAIVLWFAERKAKDSSEKRMNGVNEYWGISLLFSAFCFTIFAFLSPMMPFDNATGYQWWNQLIKIAALVTLIAGSTMLIFTSLFGMVMIWFRKL